MSTGEKPKISLNKTLQDYLKSLSKATLDELYKYPATCLSVFRELPELSRHFVLRLLFINQPVSQSVISSWVPTDRGRDSSNNVAEHKQATQELLDMSIWLESFDDGSDSAYIMNDTFQHNLKIATLGKGEPWTESSNYEPDPHQRDVEFLNKYAIDRWESVLKFLVKPESEGPKVISRDAVRTLLHAGLIETEREAEDKMQITSAGFQFLLMDTNAQVWFFIMKYLETVTERSLCLESCLSLLFKLSCFTLGKDYSMDGLEPNLLTFLQHLREFGLVYLRKRSAGRFYPTKLALNLTSGKKKISNDLSKEGNLIFETNFRIYAYNPTELQIALLSIFTKMEYRFPNLEVCTISRDSVREAFKRGIEAEQIIKYMMQHCHPQMRKQNNLIPRTIADQIKLWEIERERLKYTEGVLYKDFVSVHDFSLLCNYAASKNALVYSDEKSRTMVVTKKGHPAIKSFWKESQSR